MKIQQEMYALLKDWCDGLIAYQITEIQDKSVYGGILCPACSLIHGRCYCAVPALLYVAKKEKNPKYVQSAEALISWSDHISCPDGSFENDTMSNWRGITTFAAIALCDAYFKYGELLHTDVREKLLARIESALDYLANKYAPHGNINYVMATAYALEKGGVCLNKPEYRALGAKYFAEFRKYFSENNLIFGEGAPMEEWNLLSPKSCRPIDVGYSVEEILNHMVLYALSTEDSESLAQAQKLAESYLAFALPDGGWDNSFGTRMDKWTYWGSRTSDGCQPAFFILGKQNPVLAQAAYRNLQCLKRCTHNKMLYGGEGLVQHGEPPCVHHAFTHAAGLATALEWMDEQKSFPVPSIALPQTSRYFKELDTYIVEQGGFRATITGYDVVKSKPDGHPTGGALSLLYHEKAGILSAASMSVYHRYELYNTQRNKADVDHPLTPRLEYRKNGVLYASILDSGAKVTQCDEHTYKAEGRILDIAGNAPFEEEITYSVEYRFEENRFQAVFTHNDKRRRLHLFLPVILKDKDCVNRTVIRKENAIVQISADARIEAPESPVFNHVPGFEAVNYCIKHAPEKCTICISIK